MTCQRFRFGFVALGLGQHSQPSRFGFLFQYLETFQRDLNFGQAGRAVLLALAESGHRLRVVFRLGARASRFGLHHRHGSLGFGHLPQPQNFDLDPVPVLDGLLLRFVARVDQFDLTLALGGGCLRDGHGFLQRLFTLLIGLDLQGGCLRNTPLAFLFGQRDGLLTQYSFSLAGLLQLLAQEDFKPFVFKRFLLQSALGQKPRAFGVLALFLLDDLRRRFFRRLDQRNVFSALGALLFDLFVDAHAFAFGLRVLPRAFQRSQVFQPILFRQRLLDHRRIRAGYLRSEDVVRGKMTLQRRPQSQDADAFENQPIFGQVGLQAFLHLLDVVDTFLKQRRKAERARHVTHRAVGLGLYA